MQQEKFIKTIENSDEVMVHAVFVADSITVVIFLLLFFGISIGLFLKKDVSFSEQENRYLAGQPEFSFEAVMNGEFAKEYETYLSDQFIYRNQWISIRTRMELLLQKKEVNGVYFAADDYLMELSEPEKFESDLALKNYKYLSEFSKNYSNRVDGGLSIMLVPDKSVILGDKLPEFMGTTDEQRVITDIYNQCEGAVCINIYDELMKYKDEYIYYKTDHHWTALGSYYAYVKWCKETGLKENKPEDFIKTTVTDTFRGTLDSKVNFSFSDDSIDTYELAEAIEYTLVYDNGTDIKSSLYNMEKLNTKDKYSVYLDGNHSLLEINTSVKNGTSILIIKDSFAHCFIPYMLNQFEHIYVVDLRYYNQSLREYIETHEITNILVLYSLSGFAEDGNICKLNN